MTPADLQTMQRAASKRPHGARARYIAGCRCLPCRAANSRYEAERQRRRKEGDWNGVVSATKARRHILKLARLGIGYKTVADAAGISEHVAHKIRNGQRTQIRARTERLILGVTKAAAGDAVLVDAGPTWTRIEQLIRDGGFSKAEIARRLGYKTPALQLRKTRVTLRTHNRILRFWERYMRDGR